MTNSGKSEPEFKFLWVNDCYSEMQQKFQLAYQILEPEIDETRSAELLLPGTVWGTVLKFLNSNDLINLLYTSRCLRFFVLIKFRSYRKLSSGFCSFDEWDEKLTQDCFNLLNKLYLDLDSCVFDFEYFYIC